MGGGWLGVEEWWEVWWMMGGGLWVAWWVVSDGCWGMLGEKGAVQVGQGWWLGAGWTSTELCGSELACTGRGLWICRVKSCEVGGGWGPGAAEDKCVAASCWA